MPESNASQPACVTSARPSYGGRFKKTTRSGGSFGLLLVSACSEILLGQSPLRAATVAVGRIDPFQFLVQQPNRSPFLRFTRLNLTAFRTRHGRKLTAIAVPQLEQLL